MNSLTLNVASSVHSTPTNRASGLARTTRRARAPRTELSISLDCSVSPLNNPRTRCSAYKQLTVISVSLPELIAQTNMDQQSVGRLREEITKFTNWLGKNYATYWQKEYETPDAEYVASAKSG